LDIQGRNNGPAAQDRVHLAVAARWEPALTSKAGTAVRRPRSREPRRRGAVGVGVGIEGRNNGSVAQDRVHRAVVARWEPECATRIIIL
jgi:hypothetical protein